MQDVSDIKLTRTDKNLFSKCLIWLQQTDPIDIVLAFITNCSDKMSVTFIIFRAHICKCNIHKGKITNFLEH